MASCAPCGLGTASQLGGLGAWNPWGVRTPGVPKETSAAQTAATEALETLPPEQQGWFENLLGDFDFTKAAEAITNGIDTVYGWFGLEGSPTEEAALLAASAQQRQEEEERLRRNTRNTFLIVGGGVALVFMATRRKR